jgi:endonuclease-3
MRAVPRESRAERKKRAQRIDRALQRAYPDAKCALHFESPFQLLVATILSAQCTDEMVNQVTAELFAEHPSPQALADAEPGRIEKLVHRTGFFRQKAKSIQSASRDIVEKFAGEVPHTLEELVTLRGVARKTANVVLGTAFGIPGLAVDTHMKRINRRLGLSSEENPVKIERDLMELLRREEWTGYTHRVIQHGRECCDARRPRCETCPLRSHCPYPGSARGRAG